MFEAKAGQGEKVEWILFLAMRFVADRIGVANARTLEFAKRLVIKAEVAGLGGQGLDRHPAFQELGDRDGIGSGAEAWNDALREAALAQFRFPGSIDFVATRAQGMVLRTCSDSMDHRAPRERSLLHQLRHPEPWLDQLLPASFLLQLMGGAEAREERDPAGHPPPAIQAPQQPGPALQAQPVARFFGVPFLKGLAREITSIQLCPFTRHLAVIRDGSELEVANRLTLEVLHLGDLATARLIAFRPRRIGEDTTELAIVGPMAKREIARMDLQRGTLMPGLDLDAVTALQYSGSGCFVAAGNERGQVKVWHLGPGRRTQILEAELKARIDSLAFHPDNHALYAILDSGALAELELTLGQTPSAVAALDERAPGVRFHRVAAGQRGNFIYLAAGDDCVYALDTGNGEVGVITPGVGPISGLQVLPASGHLCVLGRHAVYIAAPVGPGQKEHLALVCPFEQPIYAACELDQDAMLVFHATDG